MVSDPIEVCNTCSFKEICFSRRIGKLCEDYSPCPPMPKTIPPKTDLSKGHPYEEEIKNMENITILNALNELAIDVHDNAVAHGWWDGEERTFGELIALCHSELSEALEEYRKGKPFAETYYSEGEKLEGIPSELADCIIRILDMCAAYKIDIGSILIQKHEFNKSRPYKHGGKVI